MILKATHKVFVAGVVMLILLAILFLRLSFSRLDNIATDNPNHSLTLEAAIKITEFKEKGLLAGVSAHDNIKMKSSNFNVFDFTTAYPVAITFDIWKDEANTGEPLKFTIVKNNPSSSWYLVEMPR